MAQGRKKRADDLPWFIRLARKEVSDLLGIRGEQVTHLINHAELPYDPVQKRYDLREVVQWFAKHRAGEFQRDDLSSGLGELRRRREEQKIRKEEMAYAKEVKQLIPISFVEQMFREMAVSLSGAGESLRVFHGDAAQKILNDAIKTYERRMDAFYADLEMEPPAEEKPQLKKKAARTKKKATKKKATKKKATPRKKKP